jgi:subtilisin family serine protease
MIRSLKLLAITLLGVGLLTAALLDANAGPVSAMAIGAVQGLDAQSEALVFIGGRAGRRGGFRRRERERDRQDFVGPRQERRHYRKRRRHMAAKKRLQKPKMQQAKKATEGPKIEQAILPPKKSDALQSANGAASGEPTSGPFLNNTQGHGTPALSGGVIAAPSPNTQSSSNHTLAGGANHAPAHNPPGAETFGHAPSGHPVLNTPGHNPDHQPHQGGPAPHDNRPTGSRPGGYSPGTHVVCLGGRFRGGNCGCAGGVPHQLRRDVFVCGSGGRDIPGLAGAPTGVAGLTPPAGADNQPSTPGQPTIAAVAALPPFAPDEVLVTVASDAPENLDQVVAESFGLEILGRWPLALIGSRLVLYRIPDGRAVEIVVAALQGDARISAPQPNYYYGLQAEPTDAAAADLSSDLQYALAKLEVRDAHRVVTGRGVRVAIIDSQIDRTHPDLDGAIVDHFDAAERATSEPDAHGTAIAGIISARGLVSGVAPEAALLAVAAFSSTDANIPAATTASLLRGLDWALKRQARIINLSLTGPFDPLMRGGIEAAIGNRAIIVAAAGNKGEGAPPAYPAAYPSVIAVTAVDIGDALYSSANRGGYIELAAPGVDVLAPALEHAHLLQSGTSFAAAHISGMIALMLEREPELSQEEVRQALAGTAKDLGAPGRDDLFGAGAPSATAALGHRDRLAVPGQRQMLTERAPAD